MPYLPPPPPPNPTSGTIEIQQFKKLHWSPEVGSFQTNGNVVVVFTPTDGSSPTRLNAQDVDYNGETGFVRAKGNIRLLRTEGEFTGEEINYNFLERFGSVTKASLRADVKGTLFTMKGERIEAKPNGSYLLENGYFTTCEVEPTPHYSLFSRRIEVSPNQYVSGKGVRLSLFGTSLFTLPSFKRSLKEKTGASLPSPGYSKAEGFTFRLASQVIREPSRTFDYDLRLSLKGLPIGNIQYQQDLSKTTDDSLPPLGQQTILTEPLIGFLDRLSPQTYQDIVQSRPALEPRPRETLFAVLQNRQGIYNRKYDKLLISRFPEIGVQFSNLLGKRNAGQPLPEEITEAQSLLQRVPNTSFLLDIAATAGFLHEQTNNRFLASRETDSGKIGLRINAATQPLLLRKNLALRFAVSNWFNIYSRGTLYNLISPEVDLNFVPTRTSFLSLGYRYANDVGSTPFYFDRRDMRHELRLTWQGSGPWGFRISNRYNMENWRAYESEVAILRNLDCLQYGIGYRFQSQQFNIIFNLIPNSRRVAKTN